MNIVDPQSETEQPNSATTSQSSETPQVSGSTEADIRALLLDENNTDLEALHNLIMMC
jgi:hypothetical protein